MLSPTLPQTPDTNHSPIVRVIRTRRSSRYLFAAAPLLAYLEKDHPGISIADLADLLDVDQRTATRWRSGGWMADPTADRICCRLGIHMGFLWGWQLPPLVRFEAGAWVPVEVAA